MITEDYVSFEVAKLLNDRGFSYKKVERRYILNDISVYRWIYGDSIKEFKSGELVTYHDQEFLYHEIIENSVDAPTLQMAMKWIREMHNFHFEIIRSEDFYFCHIQDNTNGKPIAGVVPFSKTYEEACESAIKYCLVNLI